MEHQEDEVIRMEVLEAPPPESLSLLAKAELDIQITTARAFPRSLKKFLDKATSMATISTNVAEACNYALPRDGKTIMGPTVRLAEIVAASYGNIKSAARVIKNDGRWITAQGVCHDLETNNCISVEVSRRITKKNGQPFSEDMQIVTGNAACAIAFRNAVFKVIPAALTQEVYDAAMKVARGTAETLVERRTAAIKYFKDLGVSEQQLCEVLGIQKVEDIDLDKLSILRGMVTALKNEETTIDQLFPPPADDKSKKAMGATEEALKKMMGVTDLPKSGASPTT